ncbi:MAG: hypothetical protein M5U29_09425 [Anaerolineae bacterium]|nr:hypothetical protein [Anaerolineae bacterium]
MERDSGVSRGFSGAILLIGLGVLFLVDGISFWPWILVVIGLASLPESIAQKGLWAGMQGVVWLAGLAVLFATGKLWPGILILIGVSTLVGALVRPPVFDKPKRKRGLPPDAPYDEDDDWST